MSSGYWLRTVQTNRVSRRRFVGGGATLSLAAAAAGLVACGGGNNNKNAGAPPAPSAARGTSAPAPVGAASATAAGQSTAAARPSASAAASAAVSATAGAKPQDGSYLATSGASTAFASIDIHRELYPNVEAALNLAYSHLIQYSDANKGTIAPDVVSAMPEQSDPQTYVFAIRPDVTWFNKPPANGRNLTADDVKWNIDRQVARTDPISGKQTNDFYRYSSTFKYVDKTEVVDPSHLKVTLKQPYAPWLDAMCHQGNALLLKEVAEKIDADLNKPDPNLIIGTGPYSFTAFEPGKQFIAERNPNYFGKKAGQPVQFLDSIRLLFLGLDPNPLRAAFVQKQIDYWGGFGAPFTADYLKALQQQVPGSKLYENPNPNLNLTLAYSTVNPPFNNKKLAQAFHLALDRHQALQLYYQGEGRINATVPWPYVDWTLSPDEIEKLPGFRTDKTQDLKDARAMWDAGGGPAVGQIQILVNEGANNADVPEWFAAMMNKNLGISQIKVDFLPLQSVLPHIASAGFTNLMCAWTAWESADPRARLSDDVLPGGALNFPKYQNDEVTNVLQKALAEFDVKKAQDLVKQVQRLCAADADAGKWQMVGSVARYIDQGYLHYDRAFIGYEGYYYARTWVDQKDPSFAGKPKA